MRKGQGEFKIGRQKAKRDIYQAGRDIIIQQLPEIKRPVFPLLPSLHNQTPPEPNFIGRTDMLKTLTAWWNDPKVRVGALIGWGGVGKSALVRNWYDNLEKNNIHPDGVFWWSFYHNADLELFLNALLDFASGGLINPAEIKNNWDKLEKIKRYLQLGRFLVILDGFETMQKNEVSGEFGTAAHAECEELLSSIVDFKEGSALCLITTRFPLRGIVNWEGKTFQQQEVGNLSIKDTRALFCKMGVKGTNEEIDVAWEEFKGHVLSLRLLAGYLVEDYGGDIHKTKDIPPFYSDTEGGGKAHRILRWYDTQLTEEQRSFMKIFSLFKRVVCEEDFARVFRAKIGTEVNQKLRVMSSFSFKRMKDNLCDRRLITKGQDDSYTTHPLIKNYFESTFKEKDKRACHKCLYRFIGKNAPAKPKTLEEMQPLFEQVYHGCSAKLYDEVYWNVYWKKIHKKEEHFLVYVLGAWDINLSLAKTFFPEGDLSRLPLVSKKNWQSWLLGTAGLALLNTGRPKEAEKLLLTDIQIDIDAKDWVNASITFLNLSDLQLQIGKIESALKSAKSALDFAVKAGSGVYIRDSKADVAHLLQLLGETKESSNWFKQAEEFGKKISGDRAFKLFSIWGVFYSDFLLSINNIDESFELNKENLNICQRNNWIWVISMCYRSFSAIERIKGNYQKAEVCIQESLKIARRVHMSHLEIQALIEFGRLKLETQNYKDAEFGLKEALKLCDRTGFKLYEPEAEVVLANVFLTSENMDKAKELANSAYQKAKDMQYRWLEAESAHTLGEICFKQNEKNEAKNWLTKAIFLRKEIFDPKLFDSEKLLQDL